MLVISLYKDWHKFDLKAFTNRYYSHTHKCLDLCCIYKNITLYVNLSKKLLWSSNRTLNNGILAYLSCWIRNECADGGCKGRKLFLFPILNIGNSIIQEWMYGRHCLIVINNKNATWWSEWPNDEVMVLQNLSCLEIRVVLHVLHIPTMSGLWASVFLFSTHQKNLSFIILRNDIDKKNRKPPSSPPQSYNILCRMQSAISLGWKRKEI